MSGEDDLWEQFTPAQRAAAIWGCLIFLAVLAVLLVLAIGFWILP
jgi:hypothetical protein